MKWLLPLLLLASCSVPPSKPAPVQANLIPPPLTARAIAFDRIRPPPVPVTNVTYYWEHRDSTGRPVGFQIIGTQDLHNWYVIIPELVTGLVTNQITLSNRFVNEFVRVGAHYL